VLQNKWNIFVQRHFTTIRAADIRNIRRLKSSNYITAFDESETSTP